MVFERPWALWLLPAALLLPVLLGVWGWLVKHEAIALFRLDRRRLARQQIEKHMLAALLLALVVLAFAGPVLTSAARIERRTGEVALLVDVTASMGARRNLDSPSMLQRAKPTLHDIVDRMETLGGVRVSLHGFTNMARSHVPFVGKEDYSYLRASIDRILAVNSTPGQGTGFGQPIIDVMGKFTPSEPAKLIVLFSDGEPFVGVSRGLQGLERSAIEEAISRARAEGVKVFTVGVGEPQGAKLPVYDDDGQFSGEYAQLHGEDMSFYLVEGGLRELASRTGGRYFGERDRRALIAAIEQSLATTTLEEVGEERRADQPIADCFLLAALPAWLLLARRHLL
jgi:Ca-activated chloride channel family protein